MISPYAIPGIKELPDSDILIRKIFKGAGSMQTAMDLVSEFYDIPEKDLKSRWRKRHVVWARQVFCYLCYKYYKNSLLSIGLFVNRDHTTVIHAKQTVLDLMETNSDLREEVKQLEIEIINRRLKIANP